MAIKMLKLYNGDFIIGEVNDELKDVDGKILVENPRSFMIIPTMSGTVQVALRPICSPFKSTRLSKSAFVRKDQIMFTLEENELDTEVVNGYKSEISGIKIATAAEAASINSAGANASSGSPKEFII